MCACVCETVTVTGCVMVCARSVRLFLLSYMPTTSSLEFEYEIQVYVTEEEFDQLSNSQLIYDSAFCNLFT